MLLEPMSTPIRFLPSRMLFLGGLAVRLFVSLKQWTA
jgi:hypothetical protein